MSKSSKIIIPAFDNQGNSLEALVDSTAKELCKAFGGATVVHAEGYWVNHEDKLYKEPVRVIESAAPLTTSSNQKLRDLAKAVLEVTDQEAVYVQYPDQTVEIIER